MQRPTFADPRDRFAFWRIFTSEQHKYVLVAFLDDMLDLDEPHRIVTVERLPPRTTSLGPGAEALDRPCEVHGRTALKLLASRNK